MWSLLWFFISLRILECTVAAKMVTPTKRHLFRKTQVLDTLHKKSLVYISNCMWLYLWIVLEYNWIELVGQIILSKICSCTSKRSELISNQYFFSKYLFMFYNEKDFDIWIQCQMFACNINFKFTHWFKLYVSKDIVLFKSITDSLKLQHLKKILSQIYLKYYADNCLFH